MIVRQKHIDLKGENLTAADLQQLRNDIYQSKDVGHISWGELPADSESKKLKQEIEDKIIENNQNYQRHPSDFIYALLSSHVYKYSNDGEKVEFEQKDENHQYNQYLTNWQVQKVYDKPESGRYYAVSYINDRDFQLVLAHRGTTATLKDLFNSDSPIKTNLKAILGREIVAQQMEAYVATKEAVAYAKTHGYNFSSTGHSLGAWLAELSLYFATYDFKISYAKAVTFDSPGSIVMEDYASNVISRTTDKETRNLDITTYLSAPNFVNSCNKHVGKAYRLFPEITKPELIEKAIGYSDWLLNSGGYKTSGVVDLEPLWSIFAHSLNPLIATFNPDTGKPIKYEEILDWSVIEYTPKKTIGRNMVTEWIGSAGKVLENQASSSFMSSKLQSIIKGSTLETLVDLLSDIKTGNIDQTQYLTVWQYLPKEGNKNYPAKQDLNAIQEFILKYKGHYKTAPVDLNNRVFENVNIGSADWYLERLQMLSIGEIDQKLA